MDTLYQQQTTLIHTASFYLDPSNVDIVLTPEAQMEVLAFLKRYIHCDEETWIGVTEDFFHFRENKASSDKTRATSGVLLDRPKLFWQHSQSISPFLAQLALRIFSTRIYR